VLENEPRLVESYVTSGQVRITYRHLFQISDTGIRLAEANECAGEQGQYWEMRSQLYARQSDLYGESVDAQLTGIAGELQLDTGAFTSCLESGEHRAEVEADYAAAQQAGIRARPVFEINGSRLVGFQPFEVFQQRIDALIK
jgi:protein-disulfide isomerase